MATFNQVVSRREFFTTIRRFCASAEWTVLELWVLVWTCVQHQPFGQVAANYGNGARFIYFCLRG